MANVDTKNLPEPGTYEVGSKVKTLYSAAMFFGLVFFVFGLVSDPERAWHAYVVAFFYFVSIGVGGLFFTALNNTTKAGWFGNVRRICESFTSFLPVAGVFAIGVVVGAPHLYDWLNADILAVNHHLAHKTPYLNMPFFVARLVIFFGAWIFFAKKIVGNSIKQDSTGDVSLTERNVKLSIGFIIMFALTYSLFSVDLLMSMSTNWFSTMFGIYCFAGLFQSTMAVMIITILHLKKKGYLKDYVTMDHIHDLGKYLFAFTVFWAYIAFSQFMLIWYANLPEETFYYLMRGQGGWLYVTISLLIFKFIVPFFALLPRWAKRTPSHLIAVSVLILVMQYVDIFWLVYPNLTVESVVFGLPEIGAFLGFMGMFIFMVTRFLSKNQLVATKDPYFKESVNHHVVY